VISWLFSNAKIVAMRKTHAASHANAQNVGQAIVLKRSNERFLKNISIV